MPYRLIHALRIVFRRNERGGSTQCRVTLNRHGCDVRGQLRPLPPQRRVVDLRVGDQFTDRGEVHPVLDIYCDGEHVLTDEQAKAHAARTDAESNYGWLVKAPEGYVSPITSGGLRTDGR